MGGSPTENLDPYCSSDDDFEFKTPDSPPSQRRNRYSLRSGSVNGFYSENASSRGTPVSRPSSSFTSPSDRYRTPTPSNRRRRDLSADSVSSSLDSTSSRRDTLRSACRIAGRCICNSDECSVLPTSTRSSSSSVRNMVTAPRSSRTPRHSEHEDVSGDIPNVFMGNTAGIGGGGDFVTPEARPRLSESAIRHLQLKAVNERRASSGSRNGNPRSSSRLQSIAAMKEKTTGKAATAASTTHLEEFNSTASYSSTTLNTSSTVSISSTRTTRSTKSTSDSGSTELIDFDSNKSNYEATAIGNSRTMEEHEIIKRSRNQNSKHGHNVRFSFGLSSDEDETGVLSSGFGSVDEDDDHLSTATSRTNVSAISQASERSIKIIKDVYQATKNCGSRIISATASGSQQVDTNGSGTGTPLKSALRKRPEITNSSSSRIRDSDSQSSYRSFSCDNANNSFYTERRRAKAKAAALSSRYDSDSEWYDEDEEEGSVSVTRSFMSRTASSFQTVLSFLCAPIYWILVQFFVFEKWLLNSTSRSHSRAGLAAAAGVGVTRTNVVYGADQYRQPAVPEHACRPTPNVGEPGPVRPRLVRNGAAGVVGIGGDDGGSSPSFWRLLLLLLPLILLFGCGYYCYGGGNTQHASNIDHGGIAYGRAIHIPPAASMPPSVPPTECPPTSGSPTFSASGSSEDLSRVSEELAELRRQMLASQSVPPPPCPTCQLYDDSAMKAEDSRLKQYVINLENRIQELTANLIKLEAATREKSCPDPPPIKPAESIRYEQTAYTSEETQAIVDKYLEKRMGTIVESVSEKNRDLINAAIRQYDADKTGRPDLALESGGGSVVSTRCTKKSDFIGSTVSIFGMPIYYPSNSPRKVIQPGVMPGDCWSFDGAEGFIVLKLVAPTRVTGFTLEHLPKSLSPLGHIDSAPKKFQVVGLTNYEDPTTEFVFGEYQYEDNNVPIQYFEVQKSSDTYFPYVELKILSNHGNLEYTCLYRFRVHGYLESWLQLARS